MKFPTLADPEAESDDPGQPAGQEDDKGTAGGAAGFDAAHRDNRGQQSCRPPPRDQRSSTNAQKAADEDHRDEVEEIKRHGASVLSAMPTQQLKTPPVEPDRFGASASEGAK